MSFLPATRDAWAIGCCSIRIGAPNDGRKRLAGKVDRGIGEVRRAAHSRERPGDLPGHAVHSPALLQRIEAEVSIACIAVR
jgi:hypothetical protein